MHFDSPVINVKGMLLAPLLDSEDGGHPKLIYGPRFTSHSHRVYTVLPGHEDFGQVQVPLGYDPETLRFEPRFVVSMMTPPQMVRLQVYRIDTPAGKAHISGGTKRDISAWDVSIDTGMHPALRFTSEFIAPGEIIEVQYVTGFKRIRRGDKTLPPEFEIVEHINLGLYLRASWLPIRRRPRAVVTSDSPLGPSHVSPSTTGLSLGLDDTESATPSLKT